MNGNSGQWTLVQNDNQLDPHHNQRGYLGAVFNGQHRFGSSANLASPVFQPIPFYHSLTSSRYYKSCFARFSYMFSSNSLELALYMEPIPDEKHQEVGRSVQLWRLFNKGRGGQGGSGGGGSLLQLRNVSVPLPTNFHHKYRLKFTAALGLLGSLSFSQKILVSIDRFSMDRACFGIGLF